MEDRVEQFAAIRRDARVEGLSIRELAVKYRVHRRTVRQALASAVPPPRKTPARSSPKLDPFKLAIDAMLVADTTAPRKQRHTARRRSAPSVRISRPSSRCFRRCRSSRSILVWCSPLGWIARR